jgi:chemotaxis protein histidine kinase CheA
MFEQSDEAIAQLQALRTAFAASLSDKVAAIHALWQLVKQQNEGDSDELRELYRAVHNLAGSAGTFGQAEVSVIARRLENELKPILNRGNVPLDVTQIQLIEVALAYMFIVSQIAVHGETTICGSW